MRHDYPRYLARVLRPCYFSLEGVALTEKAAEDDRARVSPSTRRCPREARMGRGGRGSSGLLAR